jgi:predicted nuclease of predicted toxin-antitoxin system
LGQADWLTVAPVRDELSRDASDDRIAAHAAANDWVLFTTDDDFFGHERSFGLLVYSQVENPRPSSVVDAIAAIDEAYADDSAITEVVPDGWL